ncbi:MAG: glycoside hydrolase family 43 protein, partial [Erythrobacter sp.]|nr:glycoside hydrolase family 43 protein [Erythrobacter sp.]
LEFVPMGAQDFAGLLAFMDENHFLIVGREGDRLVTRLRTAEDQPETGVVVADAVLPSEAPIELRIAIRSGEAHAYWRPADTSDWQVIAQSIDVEPLASTHAGLFTGLVVGPYAYAPR